jgi:hypothetical protein
VITTRSAAVRLFRAECPDGILTEKALLGRVGYLVDLVAEIAEREIAAHWNKDDVERLAGSKHSFAFKAWGTEFGWPALPGGASSRVGWIALELAGRTVRSSGHRRGIIEALLNDTPLPARSDEVSVRNNRRRIERWTQENGRQPASFWEMEPKAPRLARQAVLAATDQQFLVMSSDSMSVLLPKMADPQQRSDWAWHQIPVKVPVHLTGQMGRPTLRLRNNRVIADMPFTVRATARPGLDSVTRILGVDWGVNTPLVASVSERQPDGTITTDGRPLHFSAPGLSTKINILHRQIHFLTDKINRIGRIVEVGSDDRGEDAGALSRARHILLAERDRVSSRLSHLDSEFSHLASRWTIEQAIALSCDGVALENLSSLEPTGHGKRQNERQSQAPRSQITDKIEYKAQDVGLAFMTIHPRGTSSRCSRCGQASRHTTAPDSSKPGYRWLRCTACGISLDRDHAGSERIGARALDSKTPIVQVLRSPRREHLNISTLPARGARARRRRSLIEGRRAGSVVTPPQLSLTGHRAVGAGSEAGIPAQVCTTVNPRRTVPRRLDGLRSAYLGGIHVSPVRRLTLSQTTRDQVTTG